MTENRDEARTESAFPDDDSQLGFVPDEAPDRHTVVDAPVLEGLENARENTSVDRTEDDA